MDYERFWKTLLNYGVLEKSELKTWMRYMESVWKIHGHFPEVDKVRGSASKANDNV